VEVRDADHYMTAQFYRAWALLHLGQWGELRRVLRDGLEMAERNGHHLWARAFRFHTAWLLTHAGDFARARALCEQERQPGVEVQLGENLGSIVLGLANLGLSRFPEALRAFKEVTGRLESGPVLMDWILNMPLRLGLGEYWLVRRQFGRAREQMQELCRLAAAPGERTYLALGHRGLAEAALGEGDRAMAEREVAEALRVLDGYETPLVEWRVCATAARVEEARGRRLKAEAYWGRGAAALDRLASCLEDDGDLYRSFLAQPAVKAVRRKAKLPADTMRPTTKASSRVGRLPGSSRRRQRLP
jgi:tetratricopeptide (TPR) repeat protein